jgi:hypothetical protein
MKQGGYPRWIILYNTYPGWKVVGEVYTNKVAAKRAADLFQAENRDPGEADYTVHALSDWLYEGRSGT